MLFFINHIADRPGSSIEHAFQSVFRHTPDNLLRQVGGVVFRHTFQHGFQQNTVRSIGDTFRSGHHSDPVLFQSGLVAGAVVSVAGEPVQLPDEYHIEQALAAVLYHILKLRAVVRLGRKGPVDIVAQNGDAILLRKGGTLSNLALDTFFPLVVGGIAGIDNSFHCYSPSKYSNPAKLSISLISLWKDSSPSRWRSL